MAADRPDDDAAFLGPDWRHADASAPPAERAAAGSRKQTDRLNRRTDDQAVATRVLARSKELVFGQFENVRMGLGLDLAAVRGLTRDLARSLARNRQVLLGLARIRTRHEYTYVHSVAVGTLMMGFAQELGLAKAECELLGMAGLLHDVGKSQTPVAVLDKPGPLDDVEWSAMKDHPTRGHAILARSGGLDAVILDVALHHHERLDGSGYPDGLSGDQIGLHARMAAICDVYDALTSRRAYKDARPPALVLRKMEDSPGQFDRVLLRRFRNLIGAFPAGAVVKLQSGRVGVVLDEVPADPLSPRVLLVHDGGSRRDLDRTVLATAGDPILSNERPEDWPSARL